MNHSTKLAFAFALMLVPFAATGQEKPEILTTPPNIPAGTFPDEVNLENAANLEGMVVQYTYSNGRAYTLTFYDDRVSFEQLNSPAPVLTLPYRARSIAQDIYLVHWLVPGRIGHVSLILDLVTNTIHGSALMPGQMELFETGPITSVQRPS